VDWRNKTRLGSWLIGAFALAGPLLGQEAAPATELESFSQLAHLIRWRGVLLSIGVMIGAWLLLRFVDNLVHGLSVTFADRRLMLQKFTTFFRFGVYVAAIIVVVLLSFEISNEVLAVLGGTAAVAMGFAMKDLVASVVAGVMIMMDRPFQVGDRVSFGGQYGDITNIGLRSVRMVTLDDNVVTIPNNKFLTDITSCGNYGALDMQVVMDFHIGLDQDVEAAQRIVQEAGVSSRYVYLPKPVVVLVSQEIVDNYFALRVRLKAYVLDTKYEKALVNDVTLRVLDAFRELGIQPPAILHRRLDELDFATGPVLGDKSLASR
jgi:small-conductance mechanosensitive channel